MKSTFVRVTTMVVALCCGCSSLPPLEGRSATTALTDTSDSRFGRALASTIAAHPDKTGVYPLIDPRDAFVARMVLADVADRSLDVQYYIWHADEVGFLLFEALWRAADRGVRVRLLLDDNNTGAIDSTIAALDAHPNIEVRLYNPLSERTFRVVNFLTDFSRINRRMHNKSFTADNQLSVVGGRNVGNEYFGAGQGTIFADLDVVLAGQAVPQVSRGFDAYWNSGSAYPAADLLQRPAADAAKALLARFAEIRASPAAKAYVGALETSPLVGDLANNKIVFEWTSARVIYDAPSKTLTAEPQRGELLLPRLAEAFGTPKSRLDLVSPYFVPGAQGTAALAGLVKRGVQVRILTNSLASSDVSFVHAGYAKRRSDLLRAGVLLFELKPSAASEAHERHQGRSSSSPRGLHAKTFAVDGERIFVGSSNLDPRSYLLNTETGVLLDSRPLAGLLSGAFDARFIHSAYEVRLGADGRGLIWVERTAEGEIRHETEPETTWLQRAGVRMISVLPIEWLY